MICKGRATCSSVILGQHEGRLIDMTRDLDVRARLHELQRGTRELPTLRSPAPRRSPQRRRAEDTTTHLNTGDRPRTNRTCTVRVLGAISDGGSLEEVAHWSASPVLATPHLRRGGPRRTSISPMVPFGVVPGAPQIQKSFIAHKISIFRSPPPSQHRAGRTETLFMTRV